MRYDTVEFVQEEISVRHGSLDHLSQGAPASSQQWLSSSGPTGPGAGLLWFLRVGPGRTGTTYWIDLCPEGVSSSHHQQQFAVGTARAHSFRSGLVPSEVRD